MQQTPSCSPLLIAAIGAEDVFSLGYETLVGQTEGASLTVEAVFMPGAALIVHHIHPLTKTCDGVLASTALLGHGVLVAIDTEDLILVVGETCACQRLCAGAAHKTVAVPRLVLVVHSSGGYRLFAAHTVFGKFVVIAGAAVNVVSFGDKIF